MDSYTAYRVRTIRACLASFSSKKQFFVKIYTEATHTGTYKWNLQILTLNSANMHFRIGLSQVRAMPLGEAGRTWYPFFPPHYTYFYFYCGGGRYLKSLPKVPKLYIYVILGVGGGVWRFIFRPIPLAQWGGCVCVNDAQTCGAYFVTIYNQKLCQIYYPQNNG